MKKLLSKLKLLLVLVFIGFLIWFFGIKPVNTFKSYEEEFKNAAIRYFQLNKNELPTGERVKTLSLNTLFKKSYLKEDFLIPNSEKMCSIEDSWVKVKRDKNGEYQYYVFLDCGVYKSSVDHEGPIIKINGKEKVTVLIDEKYEDEGVKSLRDKKDGKLNVDTVVIKSDVDTSKIGTYEVKYIAFDSLNNKTTVTRIVDVVKSISSVVKKDLGNHKNYKGDVKNNYVRLSNMYFRIFGLTDDGKNVLLVSDEDLANVSHDKIEKWLDGYFYDYLNDFTKENIIESKFCNMVIDEGLTDSDECTSFTKKRKLYIPSIVEVNKAQSGEDNFMRPKTLSWVANKDDANNGFVTRDGYYDAKNHDKRFVSFDKDMNFGVKPMFVFNGDALIIKGDGTVKNPYIFSDSKKIKYGTKLSERDTGEYVRINGVLYRIIEVTKEGTTRIISMDSLGVNNYDSVEVYPNPDVDNIIYNPKDKKSIAYYINNKATEYVDTSCFVNHEITVPIYGDKIIYGEEVEKKKYTVKLAAPNMFEIFSAQGIHYEVDYSFYSFWMMNGSKTKRISGALTDVGVPMNEEIVPYFKFGVRVVAQVNKNKVIVSGKGTYFEPFKIN